MWLELGESRHRVVVARGAFDQLTEHLHQLGKVYSSALLITERQVNAFYGDLIKSKLESLNIPCHLIIIEQGESTKTLDTAKDCWHQMHRLQLDRRSLLLTLGGGMISDLGGFVAACYMRGIDCIHLPTTLLSMVDAAIGGKSAVNLPSGKNLIGAYHFPQLVLSDTNTLLTLPKREFWSGMAEIIKYGVIVGDYFFEWLEKNMSDFHQESELLEELIYRSCEIKGSIIIQDAREVSSIRATLNWGHTFGHALETVTGYQRFLHGEAISIGMCCAARASCELGLVKNDFVQRIEQLCRLAHLPIHMPADVSSAQLLDAMRRDKKSDRGAIALVVSEGIGKVFLRKNIEEALILKVLESSK
jgi:3-dehydroquinate synthase